MPTLAALVDFVSPGYSTPTNATLMPGQTVVLLFSASANAADLGEGGQRKREDSGGLSYAPAAKKSKA